LEGVDYLIETQVNCPACYEPIALQIDTSQGSYETIEDCGVCCRPMTIRVECRPGEILSVEAEA
jgi:hypothetical protein